MRLLRGAARHGTAPAGNSTPNPAPTATQTEATHSPAVCAPTADWNTDMSDPNIHKLNQLADQYRIAEHETRRIKHQLDTQIQLMKRDGYSFRYLAQEARLGLGTIQKIIAKDNT